MNVLKRRALILTLLVLCLFGLTILGASAYTASETDVAEENAVASVTVDATTYYYTSLDTAIADVLTNTDDDNTVTVLKDATMANEVTLSEDAALTIVGSGSTAPVITYEGTASLFNVANKVALTFNNVTINAANSQNGIVATIGSASSDAANATTVTLTNATLNAGAKAINLTNYPYITVAATGSQILSSSAPSIYAANSGSSVITLNFEDTLVANTIQIMTLTTNFKNVTLESDATATTLCNGKSDIVARLNNNKVGGDGAYADYLTGYYTSLNEAINAAQDGDTVYVLADATMTATDITNKDITIVGSDKHTITVASGAGYAFKLLGTEASLTVNNLVLDVTQTGKNTNAYMFGTSGSTAGTYALTLDNVDTIWLNGSGAIYGYGSIAATISLTDCSFEGGVAIINTTADATNVTMHLDNVTRVGSVLEVNTDSANRVTVTYEIVEYASDAEAIADGSAIRLGATEGGALGTVYFKNLADAVAAAQSGDTIYVLANANASTGVTLNGMTLTIEGSAGATLTSSAARLFTLTNGANLTINNLAINATVATSSVATAGNLVTFEDATATAKSTVTLTNVTLTAAGIPFFFAGASVADVTITGGSYTAAGMFSFGVAKTDLGTSDEVYFDGTANITVTGTNEKHVTLNRASGSGDTRSVIFANSSASVKDAIKVTFNYVDVSASGHAIYMRNKGTVTVDFTNGSMTSNSWLIGSQGTAVPYMTFTNVDLTGTSADHVMRPYSGVAGAYIKFIGGSITANKVAGSNPILNFHSKMDVTFTGVTFNSTSTKGLIGGTATTYQITDCEFNLTGPIVATEGISIFVKGNTTLNGAALTPANTAAQGFGFELSTNGTYIYGGGNFISSAIALIPEFGTGTVKVFHKIAYTTRLEIVNRSVHFIGPDATVGDGNYDLHYTSASSNAISVYNMGTLTFENMTVFAARPLIYIHSTSLGTVAQADKDVTLNFVNSWASGGSNSSLFITTQNHYGSDSTKKCDTLTINVDANSTLVFNPNSGSEKFMIGFNNNSHPYGIANIHGTIEMNDKSGVTTESNGNRIGIFRVNNPSSVKITISETAKLKFSFNSTSNKAATSFLFCYWTGSTTNNFVSLHTNALYDENGNSTVGGINFGTLSASCVPQLSIQSSTFKAKDAEVLAWAATGDNPAPAIAYEADDTNGTHYYASTLNGLLYSAKNGADITAYPTRDYTDKYTVTFANKKLTLVNNPTNTYTLTFSANPAFQLGDNAHLVISNGNIISTSNFIATNGTSTTATTKIDLESGAAVEIKNYAGAYFLRPNSVGILTVNVKNGSSIKLLTDGTAIGTNPQGMFDFTSNSSKVAEGSVINVDGQIIYGLKFSGTTAASNRSAMFKIGDATVDVFFTENADIQLLHQNAIAGTWNAVVCLDTTGANTIITFTGGTYTIAAECALFGLNGGGFNGTYVVDGAEFDCESFLIADYAADGQTNTTVITLKNLHVPTDTIAQNSKMSKLAFAGLTFKDEATALANGATMRVTVDNETTYANSLSAAIENVPAGGTATFTFIAQVAFSSPITIENKTLTFIGLDTTIGDSTYDLHYTGTGGYAFTIQNLANVTFQNINFYAGRPFLLYKSTELDAIAVADKDITISLVNSYIKVVGSSRFISSNTPASGNTQCDTLTLNVDATSTMDYTTTSPDRRSMFEVYHASHKYIVLNIDGTISFTDHVDHTNEAWVFVSNNPSATTITFSETAQLLVDIANVSAADRLFYFTTGVNTLTLHENAILDENGDLTLGGLKLFRHYSASVSPATTIIAESDANQAVLLSLVADNNDGTSTFSPISWMIQKENQYYYGTLAALLAASENNGTITLLQNATVFNSTLLTGKAITITAVENAVLTNTSSLYFILMGSNTELNVEDFKYQGNFFLQFTNPNGAATLNLNDNAILEGGTPAEDAHIIGTAIDAKGHITLTIGENAEIVRPATFEVAVNDTYLIQFKANNGASATVNVYGKLANLSTISSAAPATGLELPVFYSALGTTVTFNIYEGAEIEGTSNHTDYNGNWSAILYFANTDTNTANVNILGGKITSHGVNPLIYLGAATSNMKIEGAPEIYVSDLEYGLVWFANATGTSMALGLEDGYVLDINAAPYYCGNAPVIYAVSGISDAEAIAQGMYFRHNDVFYKTLADAIALIPEGSEGTIYVLGNATVSDIHTITNKKVTVTSAGTEKVTLTMTGYPNFNMDNNSHLIIDNVKILCARGFAAFVNADTTSTAKLELNAGAEVEIQHYTNGYFVLGAAGVNTGILTVDLKQGSSVKLLSDGTVSSAQQGLFQFWSTVSGSTLDAHKVAAGSTITVDGTIIYGLTFNPEGTAGSNRAAMFKMSDNTLSLFFNEHADIQLLHTNAIAGSWNNIVCMDSSTAATQVIFNGGKYTIAAECGLIGLNGTNFPGTYEVKNGADIQGDSEFLVSEYTATDGVNSTVILFQDVDLGSFRVAQNNKLPNTKLDNVGFASVEAARANYATLRVGEDATKGYYSSLALVGDALNNGDILYNITTDEVPFTGTFDSDEDAIAAGFLIRVGAIENKNYAKDLAVAIATANGETIYVLANITTEGFVLTGANVTIEGVGNITIDATAASGALFTLASSADANTTLTLKNLTITLGANNLVLANSATVNNGAHTVTAEGLTVTANADKAIFHLYSTAANLDVIDNGSTYAAQYLFYISDAGALDFDLTGTTVKATIYRSADGANGTGGTLGSATDPITLTDVILEPNNGVASSGFALRRSTTAFIEVYGGRFNLRPVAYDAAYTDAEAIGGTFISGRDGFTPVINVKIAKSETSGAEFHVVGWATNYNKYTNIVSVSGDGSPSVTFEASDASFKSHSNRCYLFAVWGTATANFEFTDCSFDNADGPGIFTFGTTVQATLNNCTLVSGTGGNFANLSFGDQATAIAFGATVRVGEATSGKAGVVYFNDLLAAMKAAPADDGNGGATNIYVLGNAVQSNCAGTDGAPFTKKVNIIGVGETAPEITNNNYWIYLGDGAEVSYTNVTLQVKSRFARGDGDFKLVFGNKCTVNNSDSIFFWDKGDGGAATYTFEIQAGAVLNVTGALNQAIFYDNASGSDNKPLSGTKVTIIIAGTINTTNKSIASDVNENGYYTIYYDARTASINTGTAAWFAGNLKNGVMFYQYANFETLEAGAAWGYATGATGMTYNNDPAAEWKYSFTYANQFTHTQHNVLNSNGGEIWQLRSAPSIYQTMEFKNEGVVTIKSYQGATITLQNVVRFRVQNTTLVLDGIAVNLNGGSSIGIHGGSAAAPSLLKLVNGAKLTGAATSASQMIYFMADNGGQYSHLYVDETSMIEQTAPSAAQANNTHVVWAHGGWANGSITIKGTVSSASNAGNVYLFTLTGNGINELTLDGATLAITGTATGNAALINIQGGCMVVCEDINNSTLSLDSATAATKKAMIVEGAISFKGLSSEDAFAKAQSMGMTVRCGDVYSQVLSTGIINSIPVGGKGDIYILAPSKVVATVVIQHRDVTIIGTKHASYDLTYTSTSGYMFQVNNIGSVTFKDLTITGGRPLLQYAGQDYTAVAVADKDIVINFVNTQVDITGSSVLINSTAHHGGVAGKQCDSITVNIDVDSVINYTATSTGEIYCISFNHNTHPTVALNVYGTLNFTAAAATNTYIYLVRSNNPSSTKILFAETAHVKATINSTVSGGAYVTSCTGGNSTTNKLTMYLDAITENGQLTLGDLKLYSAWTASCTFTAMVIAKDNTLSTELMAWAAKNNNGGGSNTPFSEAPLAVSLALDGKIYYSNLAGVIGLIPDGSTATITISTNLSSGGTINIANKTITLEGVGTTKPTLTLTGNPAFQLGDNSHLILKNINIVATSNFIFTNGTNTKATTVVDIESGVSVDIRHYTGACFLRTNSVGILTVNVKNGSSIKLLTDGTAITGNPQGLFDFTTSTTTKVAEGSVINVDGQIIYGLNFSGGTAGTNRSAMFKIGDTTIDVIFTENADIQLLHQNAIAGTWNAIVCLDATSVNTIVTFTGAKITLAAECAIYGLNGTAFNGTYEVKDITILSENGFLVSDYYDAAKNGVNSTLIKFRNFDIGTNRLAQSDRLPYAMLMDIVFASETAAYAHAAYFTLTPGTYSNLAGAIEAAEDGATIYVNTNLELTSATITNKTLTFAGSVDGITITNKTNGYLFKIGSGAHLTIKNLTYVGNYFAQFTGAANTNSSLTLGENAHIVGGELATNAFIMNSGASRYANITITIEQSASIIRPSTYVITGDSAPSPVLFEFRNYGAFVLNIYGTVQNLTTIDPSATTAGKAGANAHVLYCNTMDGIKVNIYDGAIVEGTSNSSQYGGNYSGIFYFAANGNNYHEFNIYGGTVISHGENPMIYFGNYRFTVRIHGSPMIVMPDLKYDGMIRIDNIQPIGTAVTLLDLDVEVGATIYLNGKRMYYRGSFVDSVIATGKFFNDDNAPAYGIYYRGINENGVTWYAASMNAAVKNSRNGGTIYLLGDAFEGNSNGTLDKYLFLEPVKPGLSITLSGGNLFAVTTGTKESPVRMYVRDILFKSTSKGVLFALSGNANGIFELDNCGMNGTFGVITLTGAANATITVNKGNYTMNYSPFSAVDYSNITVNVYDVTFVANGTGNENGLFFLNNKATGHYNIKGGSANCAWHTFYTMDASVANVNAENFSIITKQWGLASQSGTTWYVNLTNVDIHSTGTVATRLYAIEGSYVNIMGGKFTSAVYVKDYPAVLTFGGALAINIFDAHIESAQTSCISGLDKRINITIYGGTYVYNGTKDAFAPIMLPKEGNLTVKGGTFVNTSGRGPVFSNTAYANNNLTLEAYNAISNSSNLILNFSAVGTPSANLGAYGRLTLNTLAMTRGARPAFVGNAGAMTFKSTVSASAYKYMQSLAVSNQVKFGMLVIRTDLLESGVDFTHSGLANFSDIFGDKYELGKDYFDYKATANNLTFEEDGCVTIRLTHTGIDAENYNTKYSVVFYAEYEVMAQIGTDADENPIYAQIGTDANGSAIYSSTVYRYADYEESENARSLAEVAFAAYNNPAEGFSDTEKALLKTWCGDQVAEKTLDIFLVAGGSNAVGNTPYTQQYAETVINHQCTHCGTIADNAEFAKSNFTCPAILTHGKPLTIKDGKCYCSCGYVYNEDDGIPAQNVEAGTLVEDLPAGLTCPATLTCGAAKATFQNVLKTPTTNVFYSGIVSERAPQDFGSSIVYATASKYTPVGSVPTLGLGWTADTMGPEYGMAVELANHYSGNKYAAIMKYAVNDAALVTKEAYYGNFSGELYKNFMQMVTDQIAVYADLGYKVNVAGLYWMQGEADLANSAAYAAALQQLIANVRTDLSTITGTDLSAMPVVVGEVATFTGTADNANRTSLKNAQNTVTGVMIDQTSVYMADTNGIFLDAQNMADTGARVAAKILNAKDSNVVIPEVENTTEILDANGDPIPGMDGHTSLAMSLIAAPSGATITLKDSQTVYSSMNLANREDIVINGDGNTITVVTDAPAIALQNASVTLDDVVIMHTGSSAAITLDNSSALTIEEGTEITATRVVIEMTDNVSKLVINGGIFTTTAEDADTSDAIIRTTNANVTITDGIFDAADGSSIVRIEKNAAHRLIVNIMGGIFTTEDKQVQKKDNDGNFIPNEYDTIEAIAFVNNCPTAIMVIDPDVLAAHPELDVYNVATN